MILRLIGQRSRGQIGHSDILATRYLENPLLDRLQTLYTSTSRKVDGRKVDNKMNLTIQTQAFKP